MQRIPYGMWSPGILICTIDSVAIILAVAQVCVRCEVVELVSTLRLVQMPHENAFPEVYNYLPQSNFHHSELPDNVLLTVGRFIVLLYGCTNACCDVNMLRNFSLEKQDHWSLPHQHRLILLSNISEELLTRLDISEGRSQGSLSSCYNHVTGVERSGENEL